MKHLQILEVLFYWQDVLPHAIAMQFLFPETATADEEGDNA